MTISRVLGAGIAALVLGSGAVACTADTSPVAPSLSAIGGSAAINLGADVNAQLAAIRGATAKYHNIEKALADGFLPEPECVEIPGVAGMGHHYVNPARIDGVVDILEPEVLLYAPQGNGVKLVAVEYVVPQTFARPSLFDVPFDPVPLDPPIWGLHAWVWLNNPAGIFVGFNSRVSCSD